VTFIATVPGDGYAAEAKATEESSATEPGAK
jgi:hypothetical protein